MSTQRPHNQCTALEKMDHGTQYKLVLIVAPDGAGKTKFLHQWAHNRLKSSLSPPLRLFIDPGDIQPIGFLSKLISELTNWDPNFEEFINIQITGEQLLTGIGSSESRLIPDMHQKIETMLDEIINKLMLLDSDRFLIMLNYHLIEDPTIHKIVAYLIDYLPPNFHLIISSKGTPPLQIPRLRARRELLEIGPKDLQQITLETKNS